MVRTIKLLLLMAVGVGAWYLYTHYRVRGLEDIKVEPRDSPGTPSRSQPAPGATGPGGRKTIRIATANFGPLDQAKVGKQQVAGRLAQIIRQCDLWALQGIEHRDQSVLVRLLEAVNAPGRQYDFATAPSVGRDPVRQYSAFVFDQNTIQVDRSSVVEVEDPQERFSHPPLVGAFRARGPAENEAFTFTLINVHAPPDRAAKEADLLASVFRRVRDDRRGEDDVILLGEVGVDEDHAGELGRLPYVTWVIAGLPTTTRGSRQVDNILFDRRATKEYTLRSEVIDLMRELNLSQREALEVSEHLPVWAEFSIYEGGQAGFTAKGP